MKSLRLILIITLTISQSAIQAQEVVSSGGAYAKVTGVSLSWTIGEPVIETFSNGSYTLTQGFHQSRIGSTAVDDFEIPGLRLSVYPNPFSEELNVRFDGGDFSRLQYTFISGEGKVILNNKIKKDLTTINLQTYAPGSYFLKISQRTGETLKTFHVVKK